MKVSLPGVRFSGTGSQCPFHEDRTASLSVHPVIGIWKCFAGCGAGDLVSFHMKRTGMVFVAAVRDLLGLRA